MSVQYNRNAYVIEVSGHTAGIVVSREDGQSGFEFFAASRRFNRLEGAIFKNPHEAEKAVRRAH